MFFSNLLGGGQSESVVSSSAGDVWRGLLGAARSTASGVRVTPESAFGIPVLQNCVTLLSESIGQLPCEIYERKGGGQREAAINHPTYDVIRYRPNAVQTPQERIELLQNHLGLRGNGYELMERDDAGNVIALWPLSSDKVQVFKGPDLLPYYQVGNHAERLHMRQVHHVRWHNFNGYVGLSPVALHAESIGMLEAVRQYAGKSFSNGAMVSGVIERPKEAKAITDQKSIDGIVDQWGSKFAGVDNAKKVALLQEGMTFKPISMNMVDAEILGMLKLFGVDVARLYKIPLPLVNDLDKLSYNSLEQQIIQYVVFGLLPWIKRHEQTSNRDFIREEDRGRFYIEFNLSGLMRGDQKTRYACYALGRQWGWLSVNDIRRLENLPPIPGGDVYLQPLNMVPSNSNPLDVLDKPSAQQTDELGAHAQFIEKALQQ
ncbi:phage portal protein [Comamonas odontotermitis]|uniref:phage portal protein n=1 Tax=Comamonas odontotermitis TaxID=379895 RepID=UPI001CC6A271|nr:phage portal protein [Comamonas odontotermitis]UBB19557.1 phage portal protein [Comamonas odontotermitis]